MNRPPQYIYQRQQPAWGGMRRIQWGLLMVALCCLQGLTGVQGYEEDLSEHDRASLAQRFAPVLRLAPGEIYLPVGVEYALENSNLKLEEDGGIVVIQDRPTAESISRFQDEDSNYFLDNIHGGIDDNGIAKHFRLVRDDYTPTVYARVIGSGEDAVVQYWLYYPFNDGALNTHEGDWEMVQVIVEGGEPVMAAYSQHFSGQWARWEDVLLRRDHPIVYVARGSHANYFRSYQGVLGLQNDVVSGLGPTLGPDDYQLVLLGEMHSLPPEQAWLGFVGRWG